MTTARQRLDAAHDALSAAREALHDAGSAIPAVAAGLGCLATEVETLRANLQRLVIEPLDKAVLDIAYAQPAAPAAVAKR